MTAALPRILSLLCLICQASAVRAEDQAVPKSTTPAQHRRWFSFLRKARVQRTIRESPPVVSGVVLASLLGGGLSLWLLLRMVRYRIRAGSGSDGKAQERERAALLGVCFGFPAGMCLYDRLYPCSEKTMVSDAS